MQDADVSGVGNLRIHLKNSFRYSNYKTPSAGERGMPWDKLAEQQVTEHDGLHSQPKSWTECFTGKGIGER